MTSNFEPAQSSYTTGQRLLCATLGVAGTISVSTTAAMANMPGYTPVAGATPGPSHGWQSHSPAHTAAGGAAFSAWTAGHGQSANNGQTAASFRAFSHGLPSTMARNVMQAVAPNDLNLASRSQTFLAGSIANFKDITILVGGSKHTVNLDTKLTAAEMVAAQQVLSGGAQTIRINAAGSAAGGTIVLDSGLLSAISQTVGGTIGSVTVTHGVKVIDAVSQLTVGSLTNYGSILTASPTQGSTDTISAGTITNAAGGRIASFAGGVGTGLYSADPSLNASVAINNTGTISSAGNLTLTAPVITNTGTTGGGGTISAAQNVNINTQTLNNSGAIAALTGNVNVASTGVLAFNGSGGSVQALQGNINLTSNDADINVNGGNFEAQQVNLAAGAGNVNLYADSASGLVSASGNCAHVNVASGNLNLGNIDAPGDPIFTAAGDITIDGAITATNGADLTLIAGGNILMGAGNTAGLDTSSATKNGGNLTLVAGANFAPDGKGGFTVTDSANQGKGSAGGGFIDLTGGGSNPVAKVTTSSANGDGGYVEMVAYEGTTKNSGSIIFPTTAGIDTSSTSGGNNGDVVLIAGATSGPGITLGNVGGVTGAAFLANNVTLKTLTPSAIAGGANFDSSGKAASGLASFSTSGAANNADILVQGNTFITGDLVATTAGGFDNLTFQIVTVPAVSTGTLNGADGRTVDISAGGFVRLGNILAPGSGGQGSGSATPLQNGGNGGKGGNVSIVSSGDNIQIVGFIDVSGGGGGGGAGESQSTAATSGGAGGAGGTVTLQAAKDLTVQSTITAYDGGAGGAGGSGKIAGVGGGGGGGNGIGGGGGGGGGGLGTGTDFAAGGGGGFGGFGPVPGTAYQSGGAGGGGGALGSLATVTTGGGGSAKGQFGLGGSGSSFGFNGFGGGVGGQGGDQAGTNGGAGATSQSAGGGGGGGASTSGVAFTGGSGGAVQAVAGHGTVNLSAGGNINDGNVTGPVLIEAGTLSVNAAGATTANASALIKSTSGAPLEISGANAGSAGTVTISTAKNTTVLLQTNGDINVTGSTSTGTVALDTGTTGGNITITGSFGANAVLTTTGAGNIVTQSSGIINSTTATLNAGGDIKVDTNATTLTAVAGNNLTISQGTNTLNLGASSSGNGKTFDITAAGQLNVTGTLTDLGGTINLKSTGTGATGIDIGGAINTATGSTVNINSSGTKGVTSSSGDTVTADTINIISAGSIGTSTQTIFTKAGNITVGTGAAGSAFINDATTTVVTLDATTTSTGTLSLTSAANTAIDIVEAPYANVSITGLGAAKAILNSGNNPNVVLGTGGGTFIVSVTGDINANANNTGIQGTTVNLGSSSGSIGNLGTLSLNSPILVLNAGKGSVDASDSVATANVSGSAGSSNHFNLTDTASSGTGITVTGPITAFTITLTTTGSDIAVNANLGSLSTTKVQLSSSGDITGTGTVTATTVDLKAGGSIGQSVAQPLNTSAGNLLTANAATNAFLSQTKDVQLGASSAGTGTFSMVGGGNLTVQGPITGNGTISLSTTKGDLAIQGAGTVGTANKTTVQLTSAGNITVASLVTGSSVNATATGSFTEASGGDIAANSVTISSGGGVNISGTAKIESGNSPATSTLNIGSGSLVTSTTSTLGTVANPFNSTIINITGASPLAGRIQGAVNATGLQMLADKGADLTIDTGAKVSVTNITVDTSKSNGKITIDGAITSTGNASYTSGSTVKVTTNAVINDKTEVFSAKTSFSNSGSITASNGTLTAPTVTNTGTIKSSGSYDISTSAAGAAAFSNAKSGTLTGGAFTITNGGTGQTQNLGSINVSSLTVNTSIFDNTGGNTNVGSALTLQNPSGNLTILGTGGFITSSGGVAVFLSAKGTITDGVAGQVSDPLSGLSNANSFVVSATGNFNNALPGITVATDGSGNGGTISITAANWVFNGTGAAPAIAFKADGTTGIGGNVTLSLSGTSASGITIDTGVGNYTISAAGQDGGGTATIKTPGQLTVNMASLSLDATKAGYKGAGASLDLNGGKGVLVQGNLDTSFSGGNTGDVTITSGAKTTFVVGAAAGSTTNGLTGGGIIGDNVTISNASGVSLTTGNSLVGTSSIEIDGSTLINSGTVTTPDLTIKSASNVTINAGGTYNLSNSFTASSTGGNLLITGATPNATEVTLLAKGSITIGSTVTSITAHGAKDGGLIDIEGGTLSVSATGFKLDAGAVGGSNGNGGKVVLTLTGTTKIIVGTGKGAFQVFAQNDGTGKNGSINLATGGNLTVDAQTSNFNVGSASNSGSVVLAGKTLSVSNAKNFINATTNLDTLSLTSNSSTAFTLGGAKVGSNGVNDTNLTYVAGTINITNNGGGILLGNAVKLEAGKNVASALTLSAKSDIGKTTQPILIDATNSHFMAINSTSGSAYLTVTGGDESYNAHTGNTLNIVAANNNLTATAPVSAKVLVLTAKDLGSFSTTATSITATANAGSIIITDTATAALTLNKLSASGDVSISATGPVTAASTITAGPTNSISLGSSNGAITTKGAISAGQNVSIQAGGTSGNVAIGAAVTAGTGLSLTAAGKGNLTESKKGITVTGDSVTLATGKTSTGGNIGGSHTSPFAVNAVSSLSVNAPGTASSVYINNSGAATALPNGTAGKTFDYTGVLKGATSTITAPTLLISSPNMTASLTVTATSLQITATAGDINVSDTQNNLVKINTVSAPAGLVSISSNGAVTTAGVVSAKGDIALNAGGSGALTIGKNVTSTTGTVGLTTNTGSIIESSGIISANNGAGTVILQTTGGNIGTSTKAVTTTASTISLPGTSASVFITNTDSNASGSVTLNSAVVGSLKLTETNKTAKNTGTLTINSINALGATGAITIVSNEQNMIVATGSTIKTFNGNITLQNTYVASTGKSPSIAISNPLAVGTTTIDAESTGSTAGNVFIALGTLPTATSAKPGVTPIPNPDISGSKTPALITYGTTTNPNGSITSSNGDVFTSKNGRIAFSTGKNASSQIVVGQNVNITADPPDATTPSANIGILTLTTSQAENIQLPSPIPSATTTVSSTAGSININTSGTSAIGATPIAASGGNISVSSAIGATAPVINSQPNISSQPLSLIASNLTSNQFALPVSFVTTSANINDLNAATSNNAVNSFTHALGGRCSTNLSNTDKGNLPDKMMSPKVLTGSISKVTHHNLDKGALLFNSEEDSVVDTPFGSVSVAAGSLALIVAFDEGVSVYDLHDSRSKSVVITHGGSSTALRPGQSLLVTMAKEKSFDLLNPTQFVAYRKLTAQEIASGHKLHKAEFDLISMVRGLKPLRDMINSSDIKTRKVMTNMLKTTAIMSGLSMGGDPYAYHVPPPKTAYAIHAGR